MPSPKPGDRQTAYRRYLDAVGLYSMAAAEAAGLSPSEWYALSLIELEGAATSGQLAVRTGLTTGATTRLIDRLERAGYVRRVADPADRRKVLVESIPDALDLERAVEPARRRLGEVIGGYSAEQRAVLFDYFENAAVAFREVAEEVRVGTAPSRRRT
ncbi:MarR family transcriptional regulator [Nocardioidaceae bacterium SCSIO 66511]|nr:MarR family transcriptional regulator [Nocardioidaceae bacterium SCSIO 66511]